MEGHVLVKGTKYKVKEGALNLSKKSIENISDCLGLEDQTNLKMLWLSGNKISEIRGLENLVNLEILRLDNNQIKKIKGLENLTKLQILRLDYNKIAYIDDLGNLINLQELNLNGNNISNINGLENLKNLNIFLIGENQISPEILNQLGGIDKKGIAIEPKKFIEYCLLVSPKKIDKIKSIVLDLGTKFTRLHIGEISEKCGLEEEFLIIDTVKNMIDNQEIYAEYFKSTKSVAFNQQANIDEIDKLMATYKEWEDGKVGKKYFF